MKQAVRVPSTDIENTGSPVGAIEDSRPVTAASSPARALQQRLQMSMPGTANAEEILADGWPPYVRTAFILVSAASLWAGIIAAFNASLG